MAEPGPADRAAPVPSLGVDAPHLTRGFLFADLRDYTSYVEARGDHAGASLLERYRALVRGAVAATHGAEIKTEGDSFYVVFDSASAAVRCGQEIIAAADAADPADPIRVGVGVHAGETVETAEGYVGSAVNIAARLCAQAKAGELVVSETVRSLTRTYLEVEFEPLGTRRLKGVNEQLAIYRVVNRGATNGRGRSPRAGRRSRSMLMGIAAAVVAIVILGAAGAVLMGGLHASPTAQPSVAPSEAASLTASTTPTLEPSPSPGSGGLTTAEQALLARLPRDFQPYCRRSSLPDGSLGGAASLRCDLQPGSAGYGADSVWYDQFAESGLMVAAVNGVRDRQALAEGTCTADQSQAIGRWSMGITFTGQLACYAKDGGSWILWTYEGSNIVVRAVRHDGDAASLYGWWRDLASPYLR